MAGFKYNNDEIRKLCTETNCKLLVVTWLLYYPLSDQLHVLRSRTQQMNLLLEPTLDNCFGPNTKSPLSYFHKITIDADQILCSHTCPCSANP